MKKKPTLLLLALVLGVAAYIAFYEAKKPSTREAQESGQYVAKFDQEKITKIIVGDQDTTIELGRKGAGWVLLKPIQDRADTSVVNQILGGFAALRKEQEIADQGKKGDGKSPLQEFGLNKPKMRLKVEGMGAPPALLFGKETAVEGRVYVRFENSDDVFVVADTLGELMKKKAEEFRDRRLSDIDPSAVVKMVIKKAGREIEMRKSGDLWKIVRPVVARADSSKVANLISQVVNAHIESFVSQEKSDTNAYGLADPRGSVALYADENGTPQVLEFGPETASGSGKIYARFAVRNSIYTLAQEVEKVLETLPNDLRDRALAKFDDDVIDRVTLTSKTYGKARLLREKEEWTLDPGSAKETANRGAVAAALDQLRGARVRGFVADSAGDLAKYGLQDPRLRIVLSSYSSENVPESGAGEHPFLTASFGKEENGVVYARIEEEPFIVSVDKAVVEELDRPAVHFRALPVFRFKAEDVGNLTVRKGDGRVVTAQRGENGVWKINAPATFDVDPVAVQSLVNTLADLRAVRWESAKDDPSHGFEKPAVNIEFAAGQHRRELVIGVANSENMRFAKESSRAGVFLVNAPDFSALDLPLKQVAQPVPTPTAAPDVIPRLPN